MKKKLKHFLVYLGGLSLIFVSIILFTNTNSIHAGSVYNVTYETGTTDPVSDMPTDTTDYSDGDMVTISSTIPTRDGYTFNKWLMSGTTDYYSSEETFNINDNAILTATWIENHYCSNGVFSHILPKSGSLEGEYYLDTDCELNGDLNVAAGTSAKICLNGHTLKINNYKISVADGASLTICDCDRVSRGFGQGNDIVTITGGCIYGGYTDTNSGSIVNEGTLTIKDVDFVNNHNYIPKVGATDASGESVIVNKGYANLYNCDFDNNDAVEGGAIKNTKYMMLYNCTFKNNFAEIGGAIKIDNKKASLTLIDTEITNNYAMTSGGGVAIADDGCLAKGTKITMKDGTTKNIEDIQVNDEIKTFDHITGQLSSEKVCLVYKGPNKEKTLTLSFENNTIDIVDKHDFFEQSSRKYVTIDSNNVASYVNKYFYNANTNSYEKLLSYQLNNNSVEYYSIYTANHLNCIANNMLTVCDDVDYLLNIFELDSSLKADAEELNNDIQKYGLLSFENSRCSDQNWYNNFNAEYVYIAVGKGLFDLDYATRLLIENDKIVDSSSYPAFNLVDSDKTGYIVVGDNVKIQDNYNNVNSRTDTGNKRLNNLDITKSDDNNGLILVIEGAKNIDIGVTKEDGGIFLENIVKVNNTPTTITSNQYAYASFFSSDNKAYGVLVDKKTLDPVSYSYSLATNCVVYAANGSDVTSTLPITLSYNVGDTITVTSQTLTRIGYKFKGWNTKENGSGTTYKANDTFTFSSTIYLYAIWEAKESITITIPDSTTDYSCEEIYYGDTPVYSYSATANLKDFKFKWNTNVAGIYTTTTPTAMGDNVGIIYREEDDTYKAFSRVFHLYIGYKVTYNANGGTGAVPTDTTHYGLVNQERLTFKDPTNLTYNGYTFVCWNTKADGTGNSYDVGDTLLIEANTTFYAVWAPVIAVNPSNSNDYKVELADTTSTTNTYQWYKGTPGWVDAATSDEISVNLGSISNGNFVSGTLLSFNGLTIKYSGPYTNPQIKFKSLTVLDNYGDKLDGDGYYTIVGNHNDDDGYYYFSLNNPSPFTITDVELKTYAFTVISNETNAKIGTANEDAYYKCIVTSASLGKTTSSFIKTNKVEFDANSGNGTVPNTMYQLAGRSITLPSNSLTTEDYYFAGYNTTSNASTVLTSPYTITGDTTLYAIWKDKILIDIDENAQTYAYSSNGIAFALKGTHKDLNNYVFSYKVNNVWASNKPVNVGSYDVKIERAKDNTYAYYSKIINNGLVISKSNAVITLDTTTITKTYGDSITLPTATTNLGTVTCDKVATDLVNVGTYTVTYSVTGTANFDGDSKTLTVKINPKTIEVLWDNDDYTYNASEQVVKAHYKDVSNNLVELNVTMDKKFINAGNYSATISFKNNDSNYVLPATTSKSYTMKENNVEVTSKEIEEAKKAENGSKVEITTGLLEDNVFIVIEKIVDKVNKDVENNIKTAMNNNKSELIAKFDIHLEDSNGVTVEATDNSKYRVTLVIPISLEGRDNYGIVYIDNNNNVTTIDSYMDGNKIVFETTHFSTYAIVADEETNVGLILGITIPSILLLVFITLFILWKKEYDKKKEENNRILKFLDIIYLPINKLLFEK